MSNYRNKNKLEFWIAIYIEGYNTDYACTYREPLQELIKKCVTIRKGEIIKLKGSYFKVKKVEISGNNENNLFLSVWLKELIVRGL